MKIKRANLKKLELIGLILLAVILLGGIVFVLSSKFKKVGRKVDTTQIADKKEICKSLPETKRVLDWIEKQRDEKGNYLNGVMCRLGKNASCGEIFKSGDSGHDVIAAIWARYLYYKQTEDSNDMTIITKDLKNYAENFQVQTDFWDCKMMYQMYKDESLTKEQKKNATDICWEGTYYFIPNITSGFINTLGNSDTQIDKTLPDIDLAQIIANNPKVKENLIDTSSFSIYHLPLFAAYPSDFVARYQWRTSKHELDLAKTYFNVVTSMFLNDKKSFNNEVICRYGISSVDLWKATGNNNYLDFASYLFNSEIIPTAKTAIDFRQYVRPTCGLFADELYKATRNNVFKEKRDDVAKYLLQDYRDSDKTNYMIENDGTFFMAGDNGMLIPKKEIRTNSLAAVLLLAI